ncbi:MAG: riboflavin biosynthesis protein RibF [Actinobacteria bacterium]|nr:riboflavin biosynthesis protein RibF [Actinomycetota bacterium]
MTRVYRSLEVVPEARRAVAVGTFDGVHIGHRAVIAAACETARSEGWRSSVLTFDRHPLAQIAPQRQPRLLTPLDEKIALLTEIGPDEIVVLAFTAELAGMPAAGFCRDVLSAGLGAGAVVVGENFTFGAAAAAGAAELAAAGRQLGFRAVVVPLAVADAEAISSTRIRRLLAGGRLEEVRTILGRPPSTHGKVVGGWQRGRTLGVPTANLDVEVGTIFPGRGVYAGRALVDGTWYRTAVNVGHNPTFHSADEQTTTVRIEAHLLGFSGDLYGKRIRVDFLHKIRDEERFDRVDDLVERMRRDIEITRQLGDEALMQVGLT